MNKNGHKVGPNMNKNVNSKMGKNGPKVNKNVCKMSKKWT